MTMTMNIILFNINIYNGFAIRIGLHNSYDVILYVWRPYLKRRLRLR